MSKNVKNKNWVKLRIKPNSNYTEYNKLLLTNYYNYLWILNKYFEQSCTPLALLTAEVTFFRKYTGWLESDSLRKILNISTV